MDKKFREKERKALLDHYDIQAQIKLAIQNQRIAGQADSKIIVINERSSLIQSEFRDIGNLNMELITPDNPYIFGSIIVPAQTAWQCSNLEYHCMETPNAYLTLENKVSGKIYAGMVMYRRGTWRHNNFGSRIGEDIHEIYSMELCLRVRFLESDIKIAAMANIEQLFRNPVC